MPFTLTMPKLSPTMEAGTIVKWHKKVGDFVKANELLFEVATDKATVEYNAIDSGYLKKIIVEAGKDAVVNQAVAVFTEKKEESIEGYTPEGITPEAAPVAASVAQDKEEAQASAPPKAPSPKSGAMQQPAFVPEPPLAQYDFGSKGVTKQGRLLASPLAKKMAKDKGIDLMTVKGTGPNHRIMSRDIDLGQPEALVAFGSQEKPTLAPGSFEEEALTPMRKIIGQRLQESKTFIPHFYTTQDVRADALSATREQLKKVGIKVSINDLIVRATALALRQHQEINSGFHSVNNTLIRFSTIDIAVAVSVNGGLITPILRHADYKNLGEISAEVKTLVSKARSNQLEKHEYVGGSFTISNLGMYGITEFAAIINPPQAAILAVAGIEEKAVVEEGKIVVGKVMRLTLSADHRVIDGAAAAEFLKTLQKYLENPAVLLI